MKNVVRLTAGVLFTLGLCANAQEANKAEQASGPHEGIKVHGHWTIEVRNPDGKLVTHREFENSLQPNGVQFLIGLLSRALSVGHWEVGFGPALNTSGPCGLVFCFLEEPNSTLPATFQIFKTLVVNVQSGTQLVLSGSATAAQNGTINAVLTSNYSCPASVLPANCFENTSGVVFFFEATSATIAPVAVSNGQIIQVIVTLSFS